MFFLHNFSTIERYMFDKIGIGTFMELQIVSNSVCPKCNKHFTCEIVAGAKSCWCMSFSKVSEDSLKVWSGKGCLCPSCMRIVETFVK
jgi:hypothetical protein